MKYKLLLMIVMTIIFMPYHVYASSIVLDGGFDEWNDKPFLVDTNSDEEAYSDLVMLRWYPDNTQDRLYIYLERLSGFNNIKEKKFEDWNLELYIKSEGTEKRAELKYHPPSNKVHVKLYDENDTLLWSADGKWGDDKDTGKSFEFYMPFEQIMSSTTAGYELKLSFQSGDDRFPDEGNISVSTISTIPVMVMLLFVAWVVFLIFLKRIGINFFVFLVGSVGLFCFLMYFGYQTVEKHLEYAVTYSIWIVGRFTSLFLAYPQYSMITTYIGKQAVSFFVDYECSGFIETIVYISLLAFYPAYGYVERLKLGLLGVAYIFAANVIRVLFICVIVKAFGTSFFFFSHTVFARIIFFLLMIVLYYTVFTRPHILRQKVGNLIYGSK